MSAVGRGTGGRARGGRGGGNRVLEGLGIPILLHPLPTPII